MYSAMAAFFVLSGIRKPESKHGVRHTYTEDSNVGAKHHTTGIKSPSLYSSGMAVLVTCAMYLRAYIYLFRQKIYTSL